MKRNFGTRGNLATKETKFREKINAKKGLCLNTRLPDASHKKLMSKWKPQFLDLFYTE